MTYTEAIIHLDYFYTEEKKETARLRRAEQAYRDAGGVLMTDTEVSEAFTRLQRAARANRDAGGVLMTDTEYEEVKKEYVTAKFLLYSAQTAIEGYRWLLDSGAVVQEAG